MARLRTYSELRALDTFEERFKYLSLRGAVGRVTFGSARDMNQAFYASYQWRRVRRHVILRDQSCDLGIEGYEIYDRVYIHHMNPMTVADLRDGDPDILNPEYLISCTHDTHNAIHYGDDRHAPRGFTERRPGDTDF